MIIYTTRERHSVNFVVAQGYESGKLLILLSSGRRHRGRLYFQGCDLYFEERIGFSYRSGWERAFSMEITACTKICGHVSSKHAEGPEGCVFCLY